MAGTQGPSPLLVADFAEAPLGPADGTTSALGTAWRVFSDRVMGGVSIAQATIEQVDGRRCLRLTGAVRLENNGGFIQAAVALSSEGAFDASGRSGVEFDVRGNHERYAVHLRTTDLRRPWQYYAADFEAGPTWQTLRLPFAAFSPRAADRRLDPGRLTRLGLVAAGRAFDADLCIAGVRLY